MEPAHEECRLQGIKSPNLGNTYINITSDWVVSYLSNKEESSKLKAVKAHFNQHWTKPKFMASFVRKNELFFSTTQYQINSNLPLWTKEEMEKLKITPYVKNV